MEDLYEGDCAGLSHGSTDALRFTDIATPVIGDDGDLVQVRRRVSPRGLASHDRTSLSRTRHGHGYAPPEGAGTRP